MSQDSHEQEGVIKYRLDFLVQDVSGEQLKQCLDDLNAARSMLKLKGLVGQDNDRYGGDGFGNISLRMAGLSFLITGSQTGHLDSLDSSHIGLVDSFDVSLNRLQARGQTKPSSESMTHGVAYQTSGRINAVVHAHSPDIWNAIEALGLPFTAHDIPYGTPQMANAVRQVLDRESLDNGPIVFAMKGHKDGVVAAGESVQSCTLSLLEILNSLHEKRLSR